MSTTDQVTLDEIRRQLKAAEEQIAAEPAGVGLVPLRIACVMSSCAHGRHCLNYLRRSPKGRDMTKPGHCRDCGAFVVALPVADGRRYGNPDELVQTCLAQQNELIRAHYWHVPIDQWAMNQARRWGRRQLHERVAVAVRAALVDAGPFTSRSASYGKSIVAYAQHATASCCRPCARYWHGTPLDRPPSPGQLQHVITAAQSYLDIRLPSLAEDPESAASVGVIRSSMRPNGELLSQLDEMLEQELSAGTDPTGLLTPDRTSLRLGNDRNSSGGFIIVERTDNRQRRAADAAGKT